DRLMERIMSLNGPTHDLPPQDTAEKKFSGRNRLYVGNLTNDISEEEIKNMFSPYGEISELFVNKEKNFAFLRMDYRINAEKAKHELDGTMRKGRPIRVRFSPHSSAIKVKNLTPWVSNELLEKSFSVFGEIERAIVIVDDRGKSMGEGIVEYVRKPSALMALRKCNEGCYFLTASLRPVVVESLEQQDDIDGYPDKNIQRKNPEFFKAREIGPRFAQQGSFEHEYGTRWKQLHELYKQKEKALKREMAMEEEKLEAQMEFARYEHETELLREQLRLREADRERQKREWEMKERQAQERRSREEEVQRRQQEEMAMRIRRQEEELHRRQQENNLFMQ
ncbi:Hrp65 protein, partial [Cotesia glomerata]